MDDEKKAAVANYLLKKFAQQRNDVQRPSFLKPCKQGVEDNLRKRLDKDEFQRYPGIQNWLCVDAIRAMAQVLGFVLDDKGILNELLPSMEKFLSRECETLQPLVDVFVDKGLLKAVESDTSPELDGAKAWHGLYQGTRHKLLLANIQAAAKIGEPNGNSGSIIQSSGYGKSRTVDEMATLIPTIPMNIRRPKETKHGDYLPLDKSEVIKAFHNISMTEDPKKNLLFFFKLLFDKVYDLVQRFGKERSLEESLYQHLSGSDRRLKLYQDLDEEYRRAERLGIPEGIAIVAAESCLKLLNLFPGSGGTEAKVKMVIHIDEAHTLSENVAYSARDNMYNILLQAIACFESLPVFFLFISTSSPARNKVVAPQSTLSSSARFGAATEVLVVPSEMPFDCHHSLFNKGIQPGLMLAQVQQFSFAVQFGRPLFWAYHGAMIENGSSLTRAMIDTTTMAKGKLSRYTWQLFDVAKLAVVDVVLNLNYDLRRTRVHELASKMVADHMRTVYSVPSSRAYMHTGYPSEPVLAEAALSIIDRNTDTTLGRLLPLLRDLYRDRGIAGAIDEGERGEIIGRTILILAFMKAVEEGPQWDWDDGAVGAKQRWGRGCSLVDFLRSLTADDYVAKVLGAVPDNKPSGATLEEQFSKSWVRFTHFARAADNSVMTSHMAWIAFTRGMAMIGWSSQAVVDVFIPVLLDKDRAIEEANMGAILVQFKLRAQASPRTVVAVDERQIKFFPPPGTRRDPFATVDQDVEAKKAYVSRPYISLVMELGIRKSVEDTIMRNAIDYLDGPNGRQKSTQQVRTKINQGSISSISENVIPPTPPTRSGRHLEKDPHPRYSLFYYGCSHKTYKCIPATDDASWLCKDLLQTPTVFSDRPTGRSINPIIQQKPFWYANADCFNWIEEPYFSPGKDPQAHQEDNEDAEVMIGTGPGDLDM